ncbi:hypothetical protein CC1G_02639 [Coprinopsis cinerea okayama7|uniref:Uncharacterized protein n=1 Tax=Coprinopsis cinerea (strain Okayama-7 / 130 / ATCC MYA-4618 / FGSC 9003) TaxID=240176 RepID=A8PBG3_COPC7|nr:hypothetical protein CC1G_02639 [Coprinopsis cinerea okayama7\|eukprot:XP_001840176.1 hypothetical protein CC1G_02639 [Coprinopsis cinerea okayama7\
MALPFSSPFQQHLGTNYAPSDEEITAIREVIGKADAEIATLDIDLDRALQAVAALQKQKETHLEFKAQHEALISPIRRLPLDILQVILSYCLPSDHNPILSASEPPLLLTHICRQWREVAIGYPSLWASLHLPIPRRPGIGTFVPGVSVMDKATQEQLSFYQDELSKFEARFARRSYLLSLWLERAKGSGLSISIIYGHPRGGQPDPSRISKEDNELLKALLDVVKSYSAQWERLDISTPEEIASQIIAIPASQTPRLQQLKLHVAALPSLGNRGFTPPAGILSSPSLQSLSLKFIPPKLFDTPVIWENLTELYLSPAYIFTAIPVDIALDILEKCPKLKRCALTLRPQRPAGQAQGSHLFSHIPPVQPAEVVTERTRHIVLSDLLRLSLMQERTNLTHFIESLDLPSLRTLHFCTSILPCAAVPSSLVAILEKWGETIKTLSFDYTKLTPTELVECLRLAKNVKELIMTAERKGTVQDISLFDFDAMAYPGPEVEPDRQHNPARFGNQLLKSMSPKPGSESDVLCPRLSSLSIKHQTVEFTEEALLDFIRARRSKDVLSQGVAKIKKVKVQFAVDSTVSDHDGQKSGSKSWPLLEKLKDDADVILDDLKVEIRRPRDKVNEHAAAHASSGAMTLGEALMDPRVGLPGWSAAVTSQFILDFELPLHAGVF